MWKRLDIKPRLPRYTNTIVCPVCDAEFDPTVKWSFGYYRRDGTTTNDAFVRIGSIKPKTCPSCRTEI